MGVQIDAPTGIVGKAFLGGGTALDFGIGFALCARGFEATGAATAEVALRRAALPRACGFLSRDH